MKEEIEDLEKFNIRINDLTSKFVELYFNYKENIKPKLDEDLNKLIFVRFSEVNSKSKLLWSLINDISNSNETSEFLIQKNVKIDEVVQKNHSKRSQELLNKKQRENNS